MARALKRKTTGTRTTRTTGKNTMRRTTTGKNRLGARGSTKRK